jgi:hypothetical protein
MAEAHPLLSTPLAAPLSEDQVRDFSAWLKEESAVSSSSPFRHAATRDNLAQYISGCSRYQGDEAPSVVDIQQEVGLPRGKGPFHNLIGHGNWEQGAVEVLLTGAATAAPFAVALDLAELRSTGTAYEVISLHAIGATCSQPLDWRRVRVESEKGPDDVEGLCRERALEMVDTWLGFTESAAQRGPIPVVAREQAFAVNSPLRPDLARRDLEYALGITDEYAVNAIPSTPAEEVGDKVLVPLVFGDTQLMSTAGGDALRLRDTRTADGAYLDEHLVRIHGTPQSYYVARGRLKRPPKLAARLLAHRAIEISAIAGSLPSTPLAAPYGQVAHSVDESWRRHMLALSLWARFRSLN